MLNLSFEKDREYLTQKFRSPYFDPSTGMNYGELKKKILLIADAMTDAPPPLVKAAAFEFAAENMQIEVDPGDFFPAFACWDRMDRPLTALQFRNRDRVLQNLENKELFDLLNDTGSSQNWIDFDHSAPDWKLIFKLSFPGLLQNTITNREEHCKNGGLTPEKEAFFDGIIRSYKASLLLIDRLIERGRSRSEARCHIVAESLAHIRSGAPQNFYDALMLIYIYFIICEHIDRLQVRTLGNLDNLLLPFFEQDLKDGRFTEQEMRQLFDYFLMQWASIDNYWGHPFYLGGTDSNGNSRINRMSYLILDEFDKLSIPTPKIQLKIAANTPDEFIKHALKIIRRGNSSLVFAGEESIRNCMKAAGIAEADMADFDIFGCYECSAAGEHNENNTLCGFLNMLKPFELIFNNGIDRSTGKKIGIDVPPLSSYRSFRSFLKVYLAELQWIIDSNIKVTNEFEKHLSSINPANIFSATITNSLKTAKDAFHNGSYYNNTCFQNIGFGSAVDALSVIRELVFRGKEISLETMAEALNANWEGFEELHHKIMHFPLRYGNGLPQVDRIGRFLLRAIGRKINGRPNSRGGIWKTAMHSARGFLRNGKLTGATPDGRYAGEEMSKNISPVMGMDISGVTALIRSAIAADSKNAPGDFPLDVMMHPSAVSGEDGLDAWLRLIRVFLEKSGTSVHFNIFDAETLRNAQKNPEKYRGLQVRVCGWNVRFNDMNREEQEMYIRRAENIR